MGSFRAGCIIVLNIVFVSQSFVGSVVADPPTPQFFTRIVRAGITGGTAWLEPDDFVFRWIMETRSDGRKVWVKSVASPMVKSIEISKPGPALVAKIQEYTARGFPKDGLLYENGQLIPAPPIAETPQEINEGEYYAANLGFVYTKVSYDDGTFGTRVKGASLKNTPAAELGFEDGDIIYALDGDRFFSESDVLSHRAQTSIEFIDVRTGMKKAADIFVP